MNEVITYNLERVKISQTSFDAGLSPKTNLLQAKIDLNVYQENAINQETIILAEKGHLTSFWEEMQKQNSKYSIRYQSII